MPGHAASSRSRCSSASQDSLTEFCTLCRTERSWFVDRVEQPVRAHGHRSEPMEHPATLARRLFELTEPIGAVNFSADEPNEAMAELGFRGYWDGYFAGRSAPL